MSTATLTPPEEQQGARGPYDRGMYFATMEFFHWLLDGDGLTTAEERVESGDHEWVWCPRCELVYDMPVGGSRQAPCEGCRE